MTGEKAIILNSTNPDLITESNLEIFEESKPLPRLHITPEEYAKHCKADLRGKVEQKNKLDYLKWTYTVKFLRENYPLFQVKYAEDNLISKTSGKLPVLGNSEQGFYCLPYLTDGERSTDPFFFPVLDYRNKPLLKPNVFDINTSRMRGMVKMVAMELGYAFPLYLGDYSPKVFELLDEIEKLLVDLDANSVPYPEEYKNDALLKENDEDGLKEIIDALSKCKIISRVHYQLNLYQETTGKDHEHSKKDLHQYSIAELKAIGKDVKSSVETDSIPS